MIAASGPARPCRLHAEELNRESRVALSRSSLARFAFSASSRSFEIEQRRTFPSTKRTIVGELAIEADRCAEALDLALDLALLLFEPGKSGFRDRDVLHRRHRDPVSQERRGRVALPA